MTLEEALRHRKNLPQVNNLGITDLLKMPAFFDWVECKAADISFRMFIGGADDGVALRFFWNGCYEKKTLESWVALSRVSQVVLDIGAHTGAYTLAAQCANPAANVVSFEPYFMNFARLNLNLRANHFPPANAFMLACGDANGTAPFSISTDVSYLSTGGSLGERSNAAVSQVTVVKLDSFFAGHDIVFDLVKIDVEGFEPQCIRGMAAIVQASKPTLLLECIDAKPGAEVTHLLSQAGYLFFEINDETGVIQPVQSITVNKDASGNLLRATLNRLAIHRSRLDGLKPVLMSLGVVGI